MKEECKIKGERDKDKKQERFGEKKGEKHNKIWIIKEANRGEREREKKKGQRETGV